MESLNLTTSMKQRATNFKAAHPNYVIIFPEQCKYYVIDENLTNISKILDLPIERIMFNGEHFYTVCFPIKELTFHLKKLIAAKYKVAVVEELVKG